MWSDHGSNIPFCLASQQQKLQLEIPRMLEDELDWLSAFVPSENAEAQDIDNLVIAGHLRLIRTLLTCEGVDKKSIGVLLPPCWIQSLYWIIMCRKSHYSGVAARLLVSCLEDYHGCF
jgi:hypothetical protein